MSKFFVDKTSIKGNKIIISNKEDINHITKVLRLGQNSIIMLCDGIGNDYSVSIKDISKGNIETQILDKTLSLKEPHISVTLFQGIPKATKMEYIIQKAVELGVTKIVPVSTKRAVVKISEDDSGKNKISRWQRISYEAAKQCGRGIIPLITQPSSFKHAIKELAIMDVKLMPYENEEQKGLKQALKDINGVQIKSAGIIIGPEGGFSEEEVSEAKLAHVNIVTLGPRILRTETAGITALSILMYETGNI